MKLLVHGSQGIPVDRKLSGFGRLQEEKKLSACAVRVGEATSRPTAWPHEGVGWLPIVEVVFVHKIPGQDQLRDYRAADSLDHFESNPGIRYARRPDMGIT